MPISLPTFLVKSNPNTVPFLMSDADMRGGFRVVATHTERDAIHPGARAPGMLVLTQNDGIIWQLLSGNTSWTEWKASSGTGGGSGSAGINSVVDPLAVDVSGALSIHPNRVLPIGGILGDIPVKQSDGSVAWEPKGANAAVGTRTVVNKTDFTPLSVSAETEFVLDMGRTCMLLKVEVNAPDLLVQGFATPERDEINPYTFISSVGVLTDTGVTEQSDGSLIYNRRYSFVSNLEVPTTTNIYWRVTNVGSTAVTPVFSVTYLVLE